MPGIVVGALLIASLLLVHFSTRTKPMPVGFPLDVDDGLPWPEAGQASTVFSLSALFGAYLGVYLLLGLPALCGLAAGTVLGLFLLKSWIKRSGARSFETFLMWVLRGEAATAEVLGISVFISQCAYAASEILILREVAKVALGIRSDRATLLAVAVAIVGYFYVLFGGYMAVFRTDVLQFLLVGAMTFILAGFVLMHGLATNWTRGFLPRHGYWEAHFLGGGALLYCYHFLVGLVIGIGFLIVCPDAWKRVFVVVRKVQRTRFLTFIVIGTAPFLILPAIGSATAPIPDGAINSGILFSGLMASDLMFVGATLGFVGSFLSAFDGAMLAAVHTGLIVQRQKHKVSDEESRFHWLMVAALLSTLFLFFALVYVDNPYLLSNLLMGLFATIAGVQIGSGGAGSLLRGRSLVWLLTLGCVGWFVYVVSTVGLPKTPSTYQVNTIPGGAFLVIIMALAAFALSKKGRKNS